MYHDVNFASVVSLINDLYGQHDSSGITQDQVQESKSPYIRRRYLKRSPS